MLANASLLLGGVVLLILGSILLYSNIRSAVNRTLFGFMFAGFIWLLFNLLANLNLENDSYLTLVRLTLIGAAFLPYFFLLFCFSFVGKYERLKNRKYYLLIPVLIIVATTFSNANLSINENGTLVTGPIYIVLLAMLAVYFGYGLKLLIQEYKKRSSVGVRRTQLQYILWGITLSVIPGIILNAILPIAGHPKAAEYGANVVSIFAIFTSIAIIKHKLLDIRFVVVRALGYALSIGLLAGGYAVASSTLTFALLQNSDNVWLRNGLNVLLILIVAVSFAPLKQRFDRITNKLFYKDAYDTQDVLAELNRHVLNSVDVEPLLNRSAEIINKHIKTSFCAIELRPTAYNPQRILGDQPNFSEEDILALRTLTAPLKKRVIITEELQGSDYKLYKVLNKYDIGAVSKMSSSIDYGLEGIGLMLFGIKKSGNSFSKQDKRVIGIISSELTIATQNALRFEEIENFSATLQAKVDDATRRLKRANDKLLQMDETKDEFISMASHQLRTPLTSVKGYVSMVLEGDAGPLNAMQKKLLEQSFISSQRMVYLIADLLNLSRLKTGKFVIENVECNLADVIEGEVQQLKETAAGKNMTLVYKAPKNFPTLMLDETKIRQVIMNFVDNAIYYTPAGGKIEIDLVDKAKSIEFTVKDNGIGVPAAEQHHLFNKFYRAKNAQKARPDGTGLGLFMAKKVIVAQGGAIIFSSSVGKGSTFGFAFKKDKLEVKKSPSST